MTRNSQQPQVCNSKAVKLNNIETGKETIKKFCEAQQYSKLVIEGGLDYLIPRWEKITREIATEYRLTFDEYLNDMDCRKIISKVWPLADKEQIDMYGQRLQAADQKFFANTIPVELCVWGKRNEQKRGYKPNVDWWYYREPVRVSSKWRGNHFAHKQ